MINETLLENDSWPEYLVSAYLLQVAAQQEGIDKEKLKMSEEFWATAQREFEEQRKKFGINNIQGQKNLAIDAGFDATKKLIAKIAERQT